MVELLRKILKIIGALSKILPSIIEVLQDISDDGKINHSTKRTTSEAAK